MVERLQVLCIVSLVWLCGVPPAAFPANSGGSPDNPKLTFSSYIGGKDCDEVTSIARDDQGFIYLGGWTCSRDFPLRRPFQSKFSTKIVIAYHGFVTKIDPVAGRIVWSTYLGGSSTDFVKGIALDAQNNVIVVGLTTSRDFPVKNAFMPKMPAPPPSGLLRPASGFITKLAADGQSIIFSTYIGGTSRDGDGADVVHVDNKGNILVAGSADSKDFPKLHPFQSVCHGWDDTFGGDAFVAKFTAAGKLVYSSCLGKVRGNTAMAIDGQGNAYLTATTVSADLPTTPGVFQPTFGGVYNFIAGDAIVAKVSPAGKLLYLTYFGGPFTSESPGGIAVDPQGNAYIAGGVQGSRLPTEKPLQQWHPSEVLAFVAKLDPAAAHLVYSTYWGGSFLDAAAALSVSPTGEACVTGVAESWDFPTYRSDRTRPTGPDAFVTRFNAEGTAVIYSTLIGGQNGEGGYAILCDPWGGAAVTGLTRSPDLPMVNAFQPHLADVGLPINGEGWVAMLSSDPRPQSPSTLDLLGGRFRVELLWADGANLRSGVGHAASVSDRTGWFWFNDAGDPSLVVKIVDGRPVNHHFWFFVGGLSDVEYWMRVVDTTTGQERTYHNPAGRLASSADTGAFTDAPAAPSASVALTAPRASGEACGGGASDLCLQQDRFRVSVTWDGGGATGSGQPAVLSANSGYFTFQDPAAADVAIKVLDGRPINGHFWVFAAALSSVHYTVSVTDTVTGVAKSFEHAAGALTSLADTTSF